MRPARMPDEQASSRRRESARQSESSACWTGSVHGDFEFPTRERRGAGASPARVAGRHSSRQLPRMRRRLRKRKHVGPCLNLLIPTIRLDAGGGGKFRVKCGVRNAECGMNSNVHVTARNSAAVIVVASVAFHSAFRTPHSALATASTSIGMPRFRGASDARGGIRRPAW